MNNLGKHYIQYLLPCVLHRCITHAYYVLVTTRSSLGQNCLNCTICHFRQILGIPIITEREFVDRFCCPGDFELDESDGEDELS